MHLVHIWGVAGLVFNTAGAIGLLKFTADPNAGSPLSHEQLQSLRSAMPDMHRQYRTQVFAYRMSFGALALGFVFQLIDLLTT